MAYRENEEEPNWDFASFALFWLKKNPLKTIEYLWFLLVIFIVQIISYPTTQFLCRRAKKASIVTHDILLHVSILISNAVFGFTIAKIIKQDMVGPYFLPSLAVSILG